MYAPPGGLEAAQSRYSFFVATLDRHRDGKFVERLMPRIKDTARHLRGVVPDMNHSLALETVAKTCGMPNWHALHAALTGFAQWFDAGHQDAREVAQRLATFSVVAGLLTDVHRDLAPDDFQCWVLGGLAQRLATQAAIPVSSALDVLARNYQATSWKQLLQRDPIESTDALYGFWVDEEGDNGQFFTSTACDSLIERLHNVAQGFDDLPPEKQARVLQEVDALRKKRPEFLEAHLVYASILEAAVLERYPECGVILREALAEADSLIPKGFKGQIIWGDLDNRFYHRLLYACMQWEGAYGSATKAIQLARKQLRLNPSDNLGVRYELVFMLKDTGQDASAERVARKYGIPKTAVELFPGEMQAAHILHVGASDD